ncbi:hypothetical protein PAHAL_7G351800 [Panicum hallii]|uniref:Uncharacterized protein n=1 Tax=Panicum hallii TaxID=206008 RepID=A0A2S3IBW1_9POAL|nr:uncharacterized protein LOC112899318 isoform X2 [Panicum hallii]PAN40919.1 hypothetical protein PAHAL_7G351800 [Panicum hallii]
MAAAAAAEIRMAAVFGEARPENGDHDADALPRRPVLFHAHAHFQGPLRVVATDLRSLAWHCSLDLDDLQDLQDDVGIGGSCSDFLDYLYSSFSSAQVKLLFPAAQGANTAELVATKAKGLPRITISLHPVATSALEDVIADFSLALYASYKTKQEHASREQERVSQLMESLASERQKNEVMQKQLEALSFLDRRKATRPKVVSDQVPSVSGAPLSSDQVIVPVQQQTLVASPSKVPPAKATKRVAHVSRRARVRGALLQDADENDDGSS